MAPKVNLLVCINPIVVVCPHWVLGVGNPEFNLDFYISLQ